MKNPVSDKGLGIAEGIRDVENLSELKFPLDVDGFHEMWWGRGQNWNFDIGLYIYDFSLYLRDEWGRISKGSSFVVRGKRELTKTHFAYRGGHRGFRIVRNK
jgi:hypothetical protein